MADKYNYQKPKQTWKKWGRGARSHGPGRRRGRNPNYGKQCSYSHKMNHTVDKCYSMYCYPPWYKRMTTMRTNEGKMTRIKPTLVRMILPQKVYNLLN